MPYLHHVDVVEVNAIVIGVVVVVSGVIVDNVFVVSGVIVDIGVALGDTAANDPMLQSRDHTLYATMTYTAMSRDITHCCIYSTWGEKVVAFN